MSCPASPADCCCAIFNIVGLPGFNPNARPLLAHNLWQREQTHPLTWCGCSPDDVIIMCWTDTDTHTDMHMQQGCSAVKQCWLCMCETA